MGHQKSSIPSPDTTAAITKIKRQMHNRWSRHFAAFQAYTSKDTDQIVDDVVVDVVRGVIRWVYGPLEPVLAYWSNLRILGELKNAGLRRKSVPRADKPLEDQDDATMAKARPLWLGSLPTQEDVLTRIAVLQACRGHTFETHLANMVLEEPGLIADTNFRAQDIREEFESRGIELTIEEVHALIDHFRQLLKSLG